MILAKYDEDTNVITFPKDRKALCKRWLVRESPSIKKWQIYPHDDNKMREFLAKEQNNGREICANCVKRFYADNDD